ncbi:hypothetical protein [Synechococcus sp. MIT S9503]|uniref:hypothetical protein n=1 Tax=Synechococcus sp. MIT S9503 TaxID=3082547 RepID=UPI0039A5E8B7
MRLRFNPLGFLLLGIAACSSQGTKQTAYDIFVNEYCGKEITDTNVLYKECVRKNDVSCEKVGGDKNEYMVRCKGNVRWITSVSGKEHYDEIEYSYCYHSPDIIASKAIEDLLPQKISTICSAAMRFGKVQAQLTHSPRINEALSMKKRLNSGEDLIICMDPDSEGYNPWMLVSHVFAFDRDKERLFQLYSSWLDENGESQDRKEWERKSRKRYEGSNEGIWYEGTDEEERWMTLGVFYPFRYPIMTLEITRKYVGNSTRVKPCFSSNYVEYESPNTLEYQWWIGRG